MWAVTGTTDDAVLVAVIHVFLDIELWYAHHHITVRAVEREARLIVVGNDGRVTLHSDVAAAYLAPRVDPVEVRVTLGAAYAENGLKPHGIEAALPQVLRVGQPPAHTVATIGHWYRVGSLGRIKRHF